MKLTHTRRTLLETLLVLEPVPRSLVMKVNKAGLSIGLFKRAGYVGEENGAYFVTEKGVAALQEPEISESALKDIPEYPTEFTECHWHEYLERAHVAGSVLNEILTTHRIYEHDPEITAAVDAALDKVADVYQLVGSKQP